MSVKTEFEIRFIFDATKPITGEEREYLLGAIQQWGKFRSRSHRNAHEDVKQLTDAAMAMPTQLTDGPSVVEAETALMELEDPRTWRQKRRDQERATIQKALRETTTVAEAARAMRMPYRTFWRRMKSLGLINGNVKSR